jgi:hypothetical protein
MSLLALKRPRDSPQQPEATGCSPHRFGLQLESPASKRTRAHAEAVVAQCSSSAFMTDGGPPPADLCATLRQRVDPQTGEVLFTMDQVKDIVRRAVDEKERALREQYDRILAQKLQEQYQAFAKFNEDYISRSLKSSDLAYVS